MTPSCKSSIDLVLLHEGGYQKAQVDPGNWTGGKVGVGDLVGTNMGISAPILLAWRHGPITEQDMRGLFQDEAEEIYQTWFWSRLSGDDLPPGIAMATLDAEVMSGLGDARHQRAACWLQEAVGAVPDGSIGPATVAASLSVDQIAAVNQICDLRLNFLRTVDIWSDYGDGWTIRVEDTRSKAISLCSPA